jgi:hypothetical protein
VSPFFGLFFGLWIIHMDPSLIHSYKTRSCRNWSKMACEAVTWSHFWTASRHLGTHLAESFLMPKISWIIQPALSQHFSRVCAIFTADILRSSRIMQWMPSKFSGTATWVGLPGPFLAFSAQSSSKFSSPVLGCAVGRALIT